MHQLQHCWDAAPLVCLGAVPWGSGHLSAATVYLGRFSSGSGGEVCAQCLGAAVVVQVGAMQGKGRVLGAVQQEGPGRQWGRQGTAQL